MQKDLSGNRQAESPIGPCGQAAPSRAQHIRYGYYRSTADGRFLVVNSALVQLLGYETAEQLQAVDMATEIYRDPADRAHLIEQYGKQERWMDVAVEWKRKDGSPLPVRLSGRPVKDEQGALAYLEVVVERVAEFPVVEHKVGGAHKSSTAEVAAPRLPCVEPGERAETILLVEDEGSVRRLAREFLESSGYTVLEAESGASALAIAERHPGPIHVMVTDVAMPGMSGCELAEALRALRPDIKVLFMSGYADSAIALEGGLGSDAVFLQKPFPLSTLAEKVAELLTAEVRR